MIARDSFDKKWPNFLPDLVNGLLEKDPVIMNRVFRTLSPVFSKIKNMYRSDELYSQILYTIEKFGDAMTAAAEVSYFLINFI